MRRLLSAAVVLGLAAGAWAAPPDLRLPAEIVPQGQYALYTPDGEDIKSVEYVGLNNVDPIPSQLLRDPRAFLLDTRGLAAGRYGFVAVAASGTGEQSRAGFVVVVGTPPPAPPPGPTPPGPSPGPGPTPQPPPQPMAGMRVLIVEETADRGRLPPAQLAVLFDRRVRDYLNAKTGAEPLPDGRAWKAWRIYDAHTDMSADLPHWRELMARPRASTPWVVIADAAGKVAHEGPLPGTVEDTLKLLQQYGG